MADMTADNLRELIGDIRAHANVYSLLALASRPDEKKAAELAQAFAKFLRGIDARLSGMAAAPQWQSMETAPKNGSEVLVCWPKLELDDDCEPTGKVLGYLRSASSWSGGSWAEPDLLEASGPRFDDDWEYAAQPSLWMPLPAAPEPPHV